ncbi:MAG TPA: PAS domain S-box protein [Smithella sp.]|nr:PAS domain S-box protein [Smithella sp.]
MKKNNAPPTGNPQPLQVLMLNDSDKDVSRIVSELQKGGYHPVYERIETAAAMRQALRDKPWDIILCDSNYLKFGAVAAMALLEEEKTDIPLIVISGASSKDKTIECRFPGTRNYIVKENYSRLCPVIARELNETKIQAKHKQTESQKEAAQEELRRSEERYRKITTCIPDLIWTMDLAGHFTYVNEVVERTHGWTVDEYLKLALQDMVTPQQLAKDTAMMAEQLARSSEPDFDRNTTLTFESEELRKDGTTFLAEVTASFLWSDDGKPIGIIGITRDITERKKAEEALRKSEELHIKLVNAIPDVVVRTDLAGNILFANENALRIGGYSKDEFLGQNLLNFVAPEDRERVIRNLHLMLESRLGPREYHLMTRDGRKILFEINGDVLRKEDGTPFAVVNVCRNITERKQIEKALREKDERLRGITENLPGVIFQFYATQNGKYGITYLSEPIDEFAKILSKFDTDHLDTVFPEFLSRIHEDDRERFLSSITQAAQTASRWNFEGRVAIQSGKIIWFQGLSVPTRLPDRVIFDGILLNISERKLAEELSHKSEEKFYKIFMTTPDCIAIARLHDGLIIDVNQGFEKIVGWKREQVIGTKSFEPPMNIWLDKTERKAMIADLKTGRDILDREFKFRRREGSERFGIYSARAITIDEQECVIFILQDITDRKLMDIELKRTLESLRKSVGTTIQVMVSAIEMRDPYTAGHQLRVTDIARAIAAEMRLSQDKIDGLRMAGVIHDIGKLSVPAEILAKPTRLTKLEYSLIQEHSRSGYEILKNVESSWPLAEIVYQHHERMDGSGYPRNLKGNDILIEARILAVADVVESMASHRPYRASLGIEAALEEIEKNKGILYDEHVADVCLILFRHKGFILA